MTVKNTNRSHRLAFVVLLLVFAVALSTALVLAGERQAESLNKNTSENNQSATVGTRLEARISACLQA